MNMTKQIFVSFILLGILTGPLHVEAGGRVSLLKPRKSGTISRAEILRKRPNWILSEQISRRLSKRTRETYQQAKLAQQERAHSRGLTIGEPVRAVRRAKDMPTAQVYKDKPFLTTREQTANYMIAQSNRLFVKELARMDQLWEQLDLHMSELKEAAAHTPQPAEPITWLAQQIPAKTSILFLGEVHGYSELQNAATQLLQLLRQREPHRKIILLTEFLPENFRYTANTPTKDLYLADFEPVWKEALRNNIEVIGLEPLHVIKDTCSMEYFNQKNNKIKIGSHWAHLEGVRLRNEAWARTLEKYRTENPDALFVVYSGSAHSMYNFPFTLSTALTKEVPFVVTLFPDVIYKMKSGGWLVASLEETPVPFEEPLEQMTQTGAFPQKTLQFQDAELAKLAGFDVRLRLPIDRTRYALDHGFE